MCFLKQKLNFNEFLSFSLQQHHHHHQLPQPMKQSPPQFIPTPLPIMEPQILTNAYDAMPHFGQPIMHLPHQSELQTHLPPPPEQHSPPHLTQHSVVSPPGVWLASQPCSEVKHLRNLLEIV